MLIKKMVWSRVGFSIIEILITLAILGTIAALTMPSFTQKSNKASVQEINSTELRIAWKQTYSVIDSATRSIIMGNSNSAKDLCQENTDSERSNCLKDKYLPYIAPLKTCNSGQNDGVCWNSNNTIKFLNGVTANINNTAGIMMLSGAQLKFVYSSPNCDNNGICGYIMVDVNGFKPPNTIGQDVFLINILEKSIMPDNSDPNLTCIDGNTSQQNTGWGCSTKYLYE